MQRGFSLVELMIAMTIGLLLLTMIALIFQNVSNANKEQFLAAEQLENGRFAMDLITTDVRLAGFYGEFGALPTIGASLPDPCAIPSEGDIQVSTTGSPLAFYVQNYPAASVTASASIPASCTTWIDSASLRPGSDILVVRRLATTALNDAGAVAPSTVAGVGRAYVQTSYDLMSIQYGTGADTNLALNSPPLNARGTTTVLTRKDYSQPATGSPPVYPTTAAYIRQLQVRVYFVSNCRQGSGTNGKCTSADDTIPTLKRLELSSNGAAPTMSLVPLVEGIEFMKVNLGIDNTSSISGRTVDGIVDSVVATPASLADWQNIVMAEIHLIARNVNSSSNAYSDTKTYDLGNSITFTPSGAAAHFKRHAFVSRAYIENIGGRREFTP